MFQEEVLRCDDQPNVLAVMKTSNTIYQSLQVGNQRRASIAVFVKYERFYLPVLRHRKTQCGAALFGCPKLLHSWIFFNFEKSRIFSSVLFNCVFSVGSALQFLHSYCSRSSYCIPGGRAFCDRRSERSWRSCGVIRNNTWRGYRTAGCRFCQCFPDRRKSNETFGEYFSSSCYSQLIELRNQKTRVRKNTISLSLSCFAVIMMRRQAVHSLAMLLEYCDLGQIVQLVEMIRKTSHRKNWCSDKWNVREFCNSFDDKWKIRVVLC